MATAPDAISRLARDVIAKCPKSMGAVFSGIVGDAGHSFGYHLAPNQLPASDYSLQTARDRAGAKAHPGMASALDISFNPAGMVQATNRLIASAHDVNDPRLDGVYEFCGTTNGRTPHPYTIDGQVDDPNNTQGWDQSHTWHCHISIHRDVCDNYEAIKGIADVLAGIPLPAKPHPSPHPSPTPDPKGPTVVRTLTDADVAAIWAYSIDRKDYDGTDGKHSAWWRLIDAELNARASAGANAVTPKKRA